MKYCVLLLLCVTARPALGERCPPGPPLEQRVHAAPLVFRGLAVDTDPPLDSGGAVHVQYSAQFWLISVYKGTKDLAEFLGVTFDKEAVPDIRDRRVNVTGFTWRECKEPVTSQSYYVVLVEVKGHELVALQADCPAIYNWSSDVEDVVWRGAGWGEWTEWSSCSVSCGEGTQERFRTCLQSTPCDGFNKQSRRCNMFSCQDAVSLVSQDKRRYLHGQWGRVPGRPAAWRLRPSDYLWLPAGDLPSSARHLRRHFALLVTLSLKPKEAGTGTLFSLRSRRQQNAYLSVELSGGDTVKLVHAGTNGTQTVLIPAPLGDGKWHQLAIGVHQDSSVRSYLDCRWISTDILRRDALDIPEDADIVIGYLFSGDLEQLTLIPDPDEVNLQCANNEVSSLDLSVTMAPPPQPTKAHHSKMEHSLEKANEIWQDDEDLFEGSALGIPLEKIDAQWSEWTRCSVTCGLGVQTRQVSCANCEGKTETRPCSVTPCKRGNVSRPVTGEDVCGCQNGGSCHTRRRVCQCPTGYQGRHCEIRTCSGPCLHGGVCHNSGYCSCPPEYTGQTCQIPVCRPPCMNGGQCIKPGVCSCPTQFNHPRCASMCPGGCEPGGACVSPGVCQCLPGFTGSLCQVSMCPKGCYNGGRCVGPNNCTCQPGWTGVDCSIPVCKPACQRGGRCLGPDQCLCPPFTHGNLCQNFTCGRGCENGGVCVGPQLCECPANATGPTCGQPICDPPCENGATCGLGNTCLCAPHTSGTRCQTKNCDYRFVQEPYTRGFRKLVKKRIETQCRQGEGDRPCWRTIPEYQTVYKTFYRTVYKCASDQTH